jgi:hypothetical protein
MILPPGTYRWISSKLTARENALVLAAIVAFVGFEAIYGTGASRSKAIVALTICLAGAIVIVMFALAPLCVWLWRKIW